MFAILRRSGGLEALGRKLAVEPKVVAYGAQALLPEIMQALRHWLKAAGGGERGAEALADWLRPMGGGGLSAKLITQRSVDEDAARQISAALFPDHEAITQRISAQTGLPLELIAQLLRLLAVLVCGYIAARCEVAAVEGGPMFAEIAPLLETTRPPGGEGA